MHTFYESLSQAPWNEVSSHLTPQMRNPHQPLRPSRLSAEDVFVMANGSAETGKLEDKLTICAW